MNFMKKNVIKKEQERQAKINRDVIMNLLRCVEAQIECKKYTPGFNTQYMIDWVDWCDSTYRYLYLGKYDSEVSDHIVKVNDKVFLYYRDLSNG